MPGPAKGDGTTPYPGTAVTKPRRMSTLGEPAPSQQHPPTAALAHAASRMHTPVHFQLLIPPSSPASSSRRVYRTAISQLQPWARLTGVSGDGCEVCDCQSELRSPPLFRR